MLQRKATIVCAKDLHDYLSEHFQQPNSSSAGITLKKRVLFLIPAEGEGSIPRQSQGRTFKEVKGIRKLHSVQATPTQGKVLSRQRSCVCDKCLLGKSDSCVNSEFVDSPQETVILTAGDPAVTRQNKDTANQDCVNGLTDLVEAGSTVAIAAADDALYDYYLLKVSSPGAIILPVDIIDDYGAAYQKGAFVPEGKFLLRDNIDMTYKLDSKQAIVYANTVRAVCGELTVIKKRRKELFKLSLAQHKETMSVF